MKTIYLVIFLLFTACNNKELMSGVSQKIANQVYLKLGEYGIPSEIEVINRNGYKVVVAERDLHQAKVIIDKLGLPKEEQISFSEIVKPSGILPNSRKMELLRMDYALATQLQESFNILNDVKESRIIVRLNYLEEGMTPNISIIAKAINNKEETKNKIFELTNKLFPKISQIEIKLEEFKELEISNNSLSKFNDKGEVISYPLVKFFIWKVPIGVKNELVIASIFLLLGAFLSGVLTSLVLAKYNKIKKDNNYD